MTTKNKKENSKYLDRAYQIEEIKKCANKQCILLYWA